MRSPGKCVHYYQGYYIYPCRRPESLAYGWRWFVCKNETARLIHGETYSSRFTTLALAKASIRAANEDRGPDYRGVVADSVHLSFDPCPTCLSNPDSAQRSYLTPEGTLRPECDNSGRYFGLG